MPDYNEKSMDLFREKMRTRLDILAGQLNDESNFINQVLVDHDDLEETKRYNRIVELQDELNSLAFKVETIFGFM